MCCAWRGAACRILSRRSCCTRGSRCSSTCVLLTVRPSPSSNLHSGSAVVPCLIAARTGDTLPLVPRKRRALVLQWKAVWDVPQRLRGMPPRLELERKERAPGRAGLVAATHCSHRPLLLRARLQSLSDSRFRETLLHARARRLSTCLHGCRIGAWAAAASLCRRLYPPGVQPPAELMPQARMSAPLAAEPGRRMHLLPREAPSQLISRAAGRVRTGPANCTAP